MDDTNPTAAPAGLPAPSSAREPGDREPLDAPPAPLRAGGPGRPADAAGAPPLVASGEDATRVEPPAAPPAPIGTIDAPTATDGPATPSVRVDRVPSGAPGARGPFRAAGYIAVAVAGILLGAGGVAFATGAVGGPAPTPSPSPTPTASPSPAPAGNAIGSPDAPVTIEVWADYQCPYCRLEDLLFTGAVEREYVTTGTVRIVYRDFAFLGQESVDAAVAARCAGRVDPAAQLRYHDALYTYQQGENQGRFVRDNLVALATIAGVPDVAAFTACLDDPTVADAVAAETAQGRNVGVSSTPTLRLRGPGGDRVLTGFSGQWAALRDAIEAVRVAPVPTPSGSPGAGTSPGAATTPAASTPGPSPSATP